jgi:hypothetical protein
VVFIKVAKTSWMCLFTPLIPATREAEVGRSRSEAGLGLSPTKTEKAECGTFKSSL